MASALTGVRILDFSRHQQGPSSTVLLSDMGAEIIKVEEPGGEPGRANGRDASGFSAYFEAHNRGKKSITLDLHFPEACAIVKRIVPTCDVVLENFRPGVMERWGLGYEDLKQVRPDIIMASASAFGRHGPWAGRPGFDHVAQAFSGIMVEQGGGPDEEPHALIGGFADQIGGLMLAFGVSNALFYRERTGKGQHVDASLIGSMVSLQAMPITRFLRTGNQPGFEFRRSATYTHYRCEDGRYVAVAANSQDFWLRFCEAIERPDLLDHELFANTFDRAEHKMELVAVLEEHFLTRPASYWLDRLAAGDVPHAPVLDYASLADNPQYWDNGYLQNIEHANLGPMRVPGPALAMSESPPRIQGGGPELGQHTEEVLLEVGCTWEEIEQLQRIGATAVTSKRWKYE